MDEKELRTLFKKTTFAKGKIPIWGDGIKKNVYEDEVSLFLPECSYFGETMITLADNYENHGEDCLFIQELVKLYRQGKLTFKEAKCD